jgi:hypothetical protein
LRVARWFRRMFPHLRVDFLEARLTVDKLIEENHNLEVDLRGAHDKNSDLQTLYADLDKHAQLAEARVADLQYQIDYLKGQVEIYQARLGLLPQAVQSEKRETEQRPLRAPRVPFAVAAARIQADRTEAYWRERAAAVDAGTTGSTSESTPTVSEKEL